MADLVWRLTRTAGHRGDSWERMQEPRSAGLTSSFNISPRSVPDQIDTDRDAYVRQGQRSPSRRPRVEFGDDGIPLRPMFWNSDQRDRMRHLPSFMDADEASPSQRVLGVGVGVDERLERMRDNRLAYSPHMPPLSAGPSRSIHRTANHRQASLSPHLSHISSPRGVESHSPSSFPRSSGVASYPYPHLSPSLDHHSHFPPNPSLTAHRSSDSLRHTAENQRSSHLPPSLAAMRLEGPMINSYGMEKKIDSTLPSLDYAHSRTSYASRKQQSPLFPPLSSSSSTTFPPSTSRSDSAIPSRSSMTLSSTSIGGSASTSTARLPSLSATSSKWQSARNSLIDITGGADGAAQTKGDVLRERPDMDGDVDMDSDRRRPGIGGHRRVLSPRSLTIATDRPGIVDSYGRLHSSLPGSKYSSPAQSTSTSTSSSRPWEAHSDDRSRLDGQMQRGVSGGPLIPSPKEDGLPRFRDMFK